jgi:hypothetical protein
MGHFWRNFRVTTSDGGGVWVARTFRHFQTRACKRREHYWVYYKWSIGSGSAVSGSPTGGQCRSQALGAHHPATLIQQTHLRAACAPARNGNFCLPSSQQAGAPLSAAENPKSIKRPRSLQRVHSHTTTRDFSTSTAQHSLLAARWRGAWSFQSLPLPGASPGCAKLHCAHTKCDVEKCNIYYFANFCAGTFHRV